MPAANPSPATAVERALSMLEAAALRRDGLTNSEISRRLNIPKSSASYILRALERRGYLRRDAQSGRYRLGLKILSLGREAQANYDIAGIALPFMRSLVDRVHLTCHLAVLDQGEAVYIEKLDAPGFFKVDTWVGRRMCVHSTSVGKALLSALPQQATEAILRESGLKKRTPKTIISPSRLFAELESVRSRGYAVDDEENNLGARCMAAPILDSSGAVTAALGVSGTITQVSRAEMPRIAEALKDAARRISRMVLREASPAASERRPG